MPDETFGAGPDEIRPDGIGLGENVNAYSSLLVIKEVNAISRARTLRLAVGDIIFGVDGQVYKDGIIEFQTLMEECDEEAGVVLTVLRKGCIFNIIGYGPLGVTLEFPKPEDLEEIVKTIKDYQFPVREDLVVFEVLKDLYRRCEIIDTSPDPIAFYVPPIWLIQNRLFEPLLAVSVIYAITFAVHWVLFVISYILLALYFKRGYLMMLRSFIIYKEYQMWMVIAARDLKEAQQIVRQIDGKARFRNSLVGDPEPNPEPPKKKRKRSSIPGS